MWDPEVVILTAPRVPEEEFKCQKKVTTEDGRLKISTEIYEDVNRLVRRCNVIMEFQTPDFSLTPSLVYHKGDDPDSHYNGRLPEFALMSKQNGGIGKSWFLKYQSDLYNHDQCVVNHRFISRPPAFYDREL